MSGPVRAQLVELDSGRAVPLTEDGVSAGGLGADIELQGAETLLAFVDPIDEGFVITAAGLAAVTVNDAPVIGQRMARLGDQIAFAGRTYRIEAMAEVMPEVMPEVSAPATEMILEVESEAVAEVEPEAVAEVEPEAVAVAVPAMVHEVDPIEVAPAAAAETVPPAPVVPARSSVLRSLLGWLLVIVVVVGSAAAGYFVAAMLRGGR